VTRPWYDPRGWFRSNDPLAFDDWVQQMMSFMGNSYQLGLRQTLTGSTEQIDNSFGGYFHGLMESNGAVFACMAVRIMLFSEARFQYQRIVAGRPGELFGTQDLAILETPWPNAVTGDLLSRAIIDADLAGNFYATRNATRIWRLRPDWVTIILGVDDTDGIDSGDFGADLLGYAYTPGGPGSGNPPRILQPGEVAHFAPIPDPLATYRGMSWLTPILRETMADKAMTAHRLKFFDQGATPNMVVTLDPTIEQEAFDNWVKLMRESTEGLANAYKNMYLGGGASAQVVGANLRQIDFKQVQGAGETRIAAAAGVPPVIVGLSEGLQAATYSNYGQARRRLADGTLRPLWRNFAGSIAPLVRVPAGARLWYDDRDIPFVREDRKDEAEIRQTDASTIRALVDAGYQPESVVAAVKAGDFSRLVHTGLFSVQLQPPGTVAPPPASTNGQPTTPVQLQSGG